MHNVLARIADSTRVRVAAAQAQEPLAALQARLADLPPTRPFEPLFQRDRLAVIAEVKLASPSQGAIAPQEDPVAVATAYLQHGATALSVLTEPAYFHGDLAYLAAIREAHPDAPLLMKDFILDPYQLLQGRLAGADACLLIVAMLDDASLQALYAYARSLDLTPLVEVHTASELERALALGATLIGVNNRNLQTLEIDLDTSRQLAAQVPAGVTLICESGLRSGADLARARSWGYQGFLVGTHLMASGQPGPALSQLLEEAHHAV
ncbi:MAG: indole-3-glycerol phosphate synthase TrpC [Candidatus Sericytochromatia bacterium]